MDQEWILLTIQQHVIQLWKLRIKGKCLFKKKKDFSWIRDWMLIFTVFELLGGHKSLSVMSGGKCNFQELKQKRKTWFGQAFEVFELRRRVLVLL